MCYSYRRERRIIWGTLFSWPPIFTTWQQLVKKFEGQEMCAASLEMCAASLEMCAASLEMCAASLKMCAAS